MAEGIILKKNNPVLVKIQISSLPKSGCCVTKVMLPSCTCGNENQKLENHADMHFPLLQQSTRRQGALAFSLFGVLLAHGDLRNNKLSQLAVNLWNLSHKHGCCETRTSVSSCFRAPRPTLYTLNLLYLWMQPHWLLIFVCCRFGLWSSSNIRLSSRTWLICQIWSRGSRCSLAPELHTQWRVTLLNLNLCK